MSMDLTGPAGKFYVEGMWFAAAVEIGQQLGWVPAGTLAPCWRNPDTGDVKGHLNWEGGYVSNDFQEVTSEDAAAWATALERALPDVPDEDPFPDGIPSGDLATHPSIQHWGGGKDQLRELIAFMRAGAFTIG